ncbi:MAG: MATE family efflux transporter [Clostridiales bacterium]|nr:MATE family efflux transporter [Clostridiales bacterium]
MEKNNSVQNKENKMGTMSINKLLVTMSVPMMISMLVQALYNIVDSMFVSQISENALTAVSLAFPAQNLMIAVASGTGVGVNALLSKSLGSKSFKTANKTASTAVFLWLVNFAVFAVLGVLFSRLFFAAQTDVEEIIDYGHSYLSICLMFSLGMFGQVAFERLLQSTGKSFYSMITQSTGAVINIILDPVFIFGLFGLPKMGIAGAAIATVTGQSAACLLAIYFNIKINKEIHFSLKGFRPEAKIIKGIYSVGVPSILMIAISSLMTFGINKILIAFSTTATAVFGVYYKLQSFVFMPVFGLNNGMVPIVAYNYGAEKPERITKTLKLSIIYAVAIMFIGFGIFHIFSAELLGIFNASENMLAIGMPALRIISISFLFAGYCVVVSSVFQALGHGFFSLVVSVLRQLIVLLPAAYILSKFSLNSVWFSFPISEFASLVVCTIFLRYTYKKDINPLKKAA